MAKLFPSKQVFTELNDNLQVLCSTVKIVNATSDHLELPGADDAQLLQADRTTSDPTFYLTAQGLALAIDGATIGDDYIVVSRHSGGVNWNRGTNVTGEDPTL